MFHASVAAELSMDEILEKIQRTIATDGKEGYASPEPSAAATVLRPVGFHVLADT
jgi:hypothetical protein